MRLRIALTAALALAMIVLAGALSACGSSDDEAEAAEGEPIEVAGLSYNVQITRFLNPDDTEDSEYLAGLPPPKPGTEYLGVFLVVENETGDARPSATNYTVFDTLGLEYDFVESESPYALDVGADVPAESQLPIPDTTAATGPNHGSLLIFQVADDIGDNRPLTLKIQTFDGTGEVILDI